LRCLRSSHKNVEGTHDPLRTARKLNTNYRVQVLCPKRWSRSVEKGEEVLL
jgi:hypothetical protein